MVTLHIALNNNDIPDKLNKFTFRLLKGSVPIEKGHGDQIFCVAFFKAINFLGRGEWKKNLGVGL